MDELCGEAMRIVLPALNFMKTLKEFAYGFFIGLMGAIGCLLTIYAFGGRIVYK